MANRVKMVKMLLKITSVILLLIVVLLVWFDQSRSFYCLSEDKCVTVWKRLGNKCYIVPGKYYGVLNPSDNFIKMTNTGYIVAIWNNNEGLLIDIEDNAEIVQKSFGNILIGLYNDNKTANDSLYSDFDEGYRRYKKGVDYISIDIKENYATDKTGKKLK